MSKLYQPNVETAPWCERRGLQRLLYHVWNHSAFYRDYYQSHGITESDLKDLHVADLPFLSKQTLMENFDRAVTDPRLKRLELEQWIQDNPDPRKKFAHDFIVVHGSGSSGTIGIFVYHQKAWRFADDAVASLLPRPEKYPTGLTRAAFYVPTHGRFPMVSVAASMPRTLYDTLILSSLDSRENVVKQLNAFQPHRLYGYSSSVSNLAELAIQGMLQIRPMRIFVAGDKLTESMERKLRNAWNAPVYVTYVSSESKYIAVRETTRDEMRVLNELNIVEMLDENNRSVLPGREGRVVLTNLYNYTLPIIRYEFGDYGVRGTANHGSRVTTIRDITGRVNDALPVVLCDGKFDTIYPVTLSAFHVAHLEKIQFFSKRPDHVRIDYVAPLDIDTVVRDHFQKMLDSKGAAQTKFEVQRVPQIENDPATGKPNLVRVQHENRLDL